MACSGDVQTSVGGVVVGEMMQLVVGAFPDAMVVIGIGILFIRQTVT